MIRIKEKANKRMKEYVRQMGSSELGGLLLGRVTKDGDFVIENAILLNQQKTSSTFEIDEESMMELTKNASPRLLKSIIGWWHSHGNMGTFWSCVDDDCFKRLTGLLNGKCFGVVLANKTLGEFSTRCRLDFIDRHGKYIAIDKIKVEMENNRKIKVNEKYIAREIKKKVRENGRIYNEKNIYKDDNKFEDRNELTDFLNKMEVPYEPEFWKTDRDNRYSEFPRE